MLNSKENGVVVSPSGFQPFPKSLPHEIFMFASFF